MAVFSSWSHFIGGLLCPQKIDSHHVVIIDPALIGRRRAGPLFVLTPPVRTLAHLDDVAGTLVFARQQPQVGDFNFQRTIGFLDRSSTAP